MQGNKRNAKRQRGISLVGLILILAALGFVALLGMKVVPTYMEYRAIQNAIVSAKQAGNGNVAEIQKAFDNAATASYISSISGRDLIIDKSSGEVEISFAYEKKIPLVGFASLLLEYSGTTAKNGVVAAPKADQ